LGPYSLARHERLTEFADIRGFRAVEIGYIVGYEQPRFFTRRRSAPIVIDGDSAATGKAVIILAQLAP
jgi:hypothetical protein